MLLKAFFPHMHTFLLIWHPHTKRSHDRQRALQPFSLRSCRREVRAQREGREREVLSGSWYWYTFLTYHIVRINWIGDSHIYHCTLLTGEGWLNYNATDDQLRMSSWTSQHILSKNIDNNNNYNTSSRKSNVVDVNFFVELTSHSRLACPQCLKSGDQVTFIAGLISLFE